MGGFFLVYIGPDQDRSTEILKLRAAFTELGFAAPEIVEGGNYIFAAYPSVEIRSIVAQRYPNGDFVFVCGTCVSERGVGAAAAALLYEQATIASPTSDALISPACDALMGHYAAILRTGDTIRVTLDRFGGYQVFYNLAAGIVCSSFYALCSALDLLTLSRQSAYEYVFNGVVSGNETLFGEVAMAPIGATISIAAGGLKVARPRLPVTRVFSSQSREASLEQSITLLDRYFSAVTKSFGDRVRCALSGGYDSRLILACLRRHGTRPRVYVYGSAPEKDVRLAVEIAAREDFSLDVIDKSDRPIIAPYEFAERAYRNFLAADGYEYGGIFQNGAETAEQARRVSGNAIAVNGGGGEIFRNFFYLLDRNYTIRELLWSFYSQFDPAICTAAFDSASYYAGLERKVMDVLGSDEHTLPRPTVEWLYHSFRCRAWDGKSDSIAARYGATAMPYLERAITEHASALPLAWKNHGAYEAELIRRIDRRLAGYRSVYGHDFGRAPPLSRRVADYTTYLRPPWLRRYTYRLKYVRRPGRDWPGYLARAYREAVLPGGTTMLDRLFRLDRVGDAAQYARILSLEYALRRFGSRVRVDF
ncbi:MAG TPA: hypothetical protein VMF05_13665 [Stellaceae bacterium]|nr:hypothetical protein [Stellaceae bacterium]